MTFKHINFTDSEIMRSFEKLAHDKGIIKSDNSIAKTASVLDNIPTNNLNENILKLCSLLRKKGLESKAEELELNFLNYKFAESKDPGEKRIEDSHDKSPQFGNSEYGIIENILEEHKKILDIVRKQPTGKLANNKDIINAVRYILASNDNVEFEIKLDEAILDNDPVEIEFGEAILDNDPIEVELGEAILDKKASLKKKAQELTNAHRSKAAKDTVNKAIPYLRSADSSFRSITGVSDSDVKVFSNSISNVVKQIQNIDPSKLENFSHIISSINSLKTQLNDIKNSFWDWLNRPIFSVDDHNSGFVNAFNYLHKALLQATTAYDVLNGVRDKDLIEILSKENQQINNGEKELSKFKSQLEDWAAWFRLTKPYKEEKDNEIAASYIESQFLTPLNNISEYFNRIKNRNPKAANELIISKINEIKNSKEYLKVLNEWKPGQI